MAGSASALASNAAHDSEATPQLLAALGNERIRVLGQIVGLLTRSAAHQNMTIADIKTGLLAPVMLGQYMLAGRSNDHATGSVPVTALIWARVSDQVDQRLTQTASAAIDLSAEEWRSGDIVWLTEAVGDLRAIPEMIERLRSTDTKISAIRVASPGVDGKITVRTL
jgi:hemolysin-activating ACP:hemolysin acyltransferase